MGTMSWISSCDSHHRLVTCRPSHYCKSVPYSWYLQSFNAVPAPWKLAVPLRGIISCESAHSEVCLGHWIMHISMLHFLYATIFCLLLSIAGVDARAVDLYITARPKSSIHPPILSDSGNITDFPQRCINIDNCRPLDDVAESYFVAVLSLILARSAMKH